MPRLVSRLHTASLVILGLACFACKVAVPQPPQLTIALNPKARAHTPPPPKVEVELRAGVGAAEVQTGAQVQVEAQVEIEAEVEVEAAAGAYVEAEVEPPQPTIPVALEGAAVVEFFGIPLEGTQDVVFVLDRSGSMEELALGQIAQLGSPQAVQPEPLPVPPAGAQPAPPENVQPLPPAVASAQGAQQQETPPQVQVPRKIDVAHAELVNALERLPAGTRMNVLFFNNRLEALQATIAPLKEGDREDVIDFVRETFPDGQTALAPAMRTAFLMNARRIILLSDGLGNVGGDAESVIRDAREAMRGGVRIDTIGLGQDQNAWLLQTLARESGGIYQPL